MNDLLDGINPDGLSGWSTIASFLLGSAFVLLIVAVGIGVVMAVWGRHHLQSGSARKGWTVTALSGIGAMVLGSASAGIAWGAEQGTASLMPEGARPQAVTVEKQAPKHTCNRQAVRDFNKEDPTPSRAEIEKAIKAVAGNDASIPDYTFGKEDDPTRLFKFTSLKWTADGAGGD